MWNISFCIQNSLIIILFIYYFVSFFLSLSPSVCHSFSWIREIILELFIKCKILWRFTKIVFQLHHINIDNKIIETGAAAAVAAASNKNKHLKGKKTEVKYSGAWLCAFSVFFGGSSRVRVRAYDVLFFALLNCSVSERYSLVWWCSLCVRVYTHTHLWTAAVFCNKSKQE